MEDIILADVAMIERATNMQHKQDAKEDRQIDVKREDCSGNRFIVRREGGD